MLAVHAGAGFHSPSLEAAYKRDLAAACQAGAAALAGGGDALAAVTAAIRVLEDSKHCNAGRGSNLSFQGLVECDASVMDGDGTFGAVAAAPGILHPVDAAALVARESRQPLSNGRVRPIMLAGDRAREWAVARGLPAAATAAEAVEWHVTGAAQAQWRKYRRIVDDSTGGGGGSATPGAHAGHGQQHEAGQAAEEQQEGEPQPGAAKRARHGSSGDQQHGTGSLYDTVGCVALAPDGTVAAGVSSGGIVLKTEGRVGEAAVYGAGCWAQQAAQQAAGAAAGRQQGVAPALACSVTGVGEHVMRHLLARECCRAAFDAAAAAAVEAADDGMGGAAGTEAPLAHVAAQLLQRTVLCGPPPHDCGLLCLKAQALEQECGGAAAALPQRQSSGTSGSGGGQQAQRQQQYEVEVAVAHSAQSMAVAHLCCGGGGSAGGAGRQRRGGEAEQQQGRGGATPAIHILRRATSGSGQPAPAVQTYMLGCKVRV